MANRYWVGGTDNWNGTAGTKRALTSGGAGGQAVPTSSDDVFLDGASGAVTVTISATANCLSLNTTGFTGTLAGASTLNIAGSLTLGSGMTRTYTGTINFTSTSTGRTITSNSIVLASSVNFTGSGGEWILQDNFNIGNGLIGHTAGTFDANTSNVTCLRYSTSGSTVRSLKMGSGTWDIIDTGSATSWSISSTTNLTFDAETSTVKFTGNSANTRGFAGGGLTYYNFWNASLGVGVISVTGSNTFNDFRIDAGRTQRFQSTSTTTVTTFTATGSSGNEITINSGVASAHNLSKSGGGVISCDWLILTYSQASPGTTWYAGANSTDSGNNTGWIFANAPSTANSNFFMFM